MNEYQFFSPVDVVFGCGSLSKLHTLKMPGKKALLVISNGKSARMNGSLDRTIDELKQADVSYVLYNGIGANPLKSAVEEGARIGRENGVDFVIALGGGSVMDAAKNMAMFIPQPSDNLWDYANSPSGGKMTPPNRGIGQRGHAHAAACHRNVVLLELLRGAEMAPHRLERRRTYRAVAQCHGA